jgi:hypothetical protein
MLGVSVHAPGQCTFIRGDVDGNGTLTVSDAARLSQWLNGNSLAIRVVASDVDGDDTVSTNDVNYLLHYLFTHGLRPPDPFPQAGLDPLYPVFIRGDADGDGLITTNDSHTIRQYLFNNGSMCVLAAADANGSGTITITDSIYIDQYLFNGGPPPPAPFPRPGITVPLITEFMANNDGSLVDEDGHTNDWIEIHNPTAVAIDLYDYGLSCNLNPDTRWRFPHYAIPGGGYIIVFASSKNRKPAAPGQLHTDFGLRAQGEDLVLWSPAGAIIHMFHPFPAQYNGVSYGWVEAEEYFRRPSPGGPFVQPPVIDAQGGIYLSSFNVSLTGQPGFPIFFTLDGSAPPPGGILYTGSVTVSRTTTLRAAAVRNGTGSAVETRTYLFLTNALSQTKPGSYPILTEINDNTSSANADESRIDYDMVVAAANRASVSNALLLAPSVSIVMNVADLFGELPPTGVGGKPQNGIYPNSLTAQAAEDALIRQLFPELHPLSPEHYAKPCSFEWIDPLTGAYSQVEARIRIMGSSTRHWATTKKKGFRFQFDFPQQPHGPVAGFAQNVFSDQGVAFFRDLALRSNGHDSWTVNMGWGDPGRIWLTRCTNALYANEQWARDTLDAMGHVSPRIRYVHLYLNGLYWGVYGLSERPNEDFMASYYGGFPGQYYVLHDPKGVVNTDNDVGDNLWNTMQATTTFSVADERLDMIEYIDYIIMNVFMMNRDWPSQNFIAGSMAIPPPKSVDERFKFFSWDAEWAISLRNDPFTSDPIKFDESGVSGGAASVYGHLRNQQAFKDIFASRLTLHCNNGGALSLSNAKARMQNILNSFSLVLRAEEARWGDTYRTPAFGFSEWTNNTNFVVGTWFQQRGYHMFNHFNARMNLGLPNPYPVPP